MKIYIFLPIFVGLSILGASCTKEVRYNREELYKMAKKADPTLSFVLPRTMQEGVNCADYPAGCIAGHTVKVQGLEMIVVEFVDEDHAIVAAKKLRGYYLRNWLLDDVTGEPKLEKFVVEKLEAKKP